MGCAFWGTTGPKEPTAGEIEHGYQSSPPVYAAAPPSEEMAPGPVFESAPELAEPSRTPGRQHSAANAASSESHQVAYEGPEVDEVEDDLFDDGDEEERFGVSASGRGVERVHPLAAVSATELRRRLQHEPSSLGPMSVGAPNAGALFNAVQLPEDPRWQRVSPSAAWGTQETIDFLSSAIGRVVEQYPDSLPVAIGHISDRDGGPLRPHRSHQAGADVDVGYYHKPEAHRWYQRATRENLDLPRTWALVRALITETDVRLILIDHSIQAWLREYAESIREDAAWLDDIFGAKGSTRPALIRHAPGHATHLHVRFYNPIAEETARRCYSGLVALGKVKLQPSFVSYKARKGDTLLALAKRFGTTVKAIKRANGLRSNTILAKRVYKIPSVDRPKITLTRAQSVPPRRLPPRQNSNQSLSRL